jgi:hypothetical protein
MVILVLPGSDGTTGPIFLALLKSYSAFIFFHFISRGFAGGNDPDLATSCCVDDNQNVAEIIGSQDHLARFSANILLLHPQGFRIIEHARSLEKAEPVLFLFILT